MIPWWVYFILFLVCVPFVIEAVMDYSDYGEDPDPEEYMGQWTEEEQADRELMFERERETGRWWW